MKYRQHIMIRYSNYWRIMGLGEVNIGWLFGSCSKDGLIYGAAGSLKLWVSYSGMRKDPRARIGSLSSQHLKRGQRVIKSQGLMIVCIFGVCSVEWDAMSRFTHKANMSILSSSRMRRNTATHRIAVMTTIAADLPGRLSSMASGFCTDNEHKPHL